MGSRIDLSVCGMVCFHLCYSSLQRQRHDTWIKLATLHTLLQCASDPVKHRQKSWCLLVAFYFLTYVGTSSPALQGLGYSGNYPALHEERTKVLCAGKYIVQEVQEHNPWTLTCSNRNIINYVKIKCSFYF